MPGPEPVSPQGIAEERAEKFRREHDRQESIRRQDRRGAAELVTRLYSRGPELRHDGTDAGQHHRPASPYSQPRPRCNCGCQPSTGDQLDALTGDYSGRSALLDQLADQIMDPTEIREDAERRVRAGLRGLDYVPAGAASALEWLNAHRATEFRPEYGP